MNLSPNPFTHALKNGQSQVGLWVSSCSNYATQVLSSSGFDWMVLDMEHSPNTLPTVLSQLQVLEASSTTAVVRPECNDTVLIKRLLDIGARALIIPMVQTVEEAEYAVAATRYPPRGVRGVSGSTRANDFGRIKDYFQKVEEETTLIVQIETRSAIEIAEDIGSVDGVSGVFFGPADIAADIGLIGQPNHPDVWALIKPSAQKLMAKGIPVGTLMLNEDFATELFKEGFNFVACGTDLSLLAKHSDALAKHMKTSIS